MSLILGLIFAGLVALAMLTVTAIIDATLDYLNGADSVLIVDPSVSHELERIASTRGSKAHKRFAYDRASRKAVMVEANRIAPELQGERVLEVAIT